MKQKELYPNDGIEASESGAAGIDSRCRVRPKDRRSISGVSKKYVAPLIGGALALGLLLSILPPDWHDGFRIGGLPLIHIAGFAAATALMALLIGGGWRLLPIAGGLFLYGVVIEAAQTQVAWRSGKIADLSYNAAGIAAGVALYLVIAGIFRAGRYMAKTGKRRT